MYHRKKFLNFSAFFPSNSLLHHSVCKYLKIKKMHTLYILVKYIFKIVITENFYFSVKFFYNSCANLGNIFYVSLKIISSVEYTLI